MAVLVRKAQPDDSPTIARLHRETISWGLLSQLGDRVVTAFYRVMTESPASFCFVAEQGGQIQGFAAAVTHWPTLHQHVRRRTWWPLMQAAPALMISGRWRKLLETSRYSQSRLEGVDAEFMAFGVREGAPGRVWAGAALVNAVITEFRRQGVTRFRGVVGGQNERALKFFQSVGFHFAAEVEIHPGEVSRTHVEELNPTAWGVQ